MARGKQRYTKWCATCGKKVADGHAHYNPDKIEIIASNGTRIKGLPDGAIIYVGVDWAKPDAP